MRKADRMIGIIAGILGFVAAFALLFTGGRGSAFEVPVKPQLAATQLLSQAQPPSSGPGIIGTWTGRLEGDGEMDIDPAPGGFKVILRVSSSSGCIGSIEGFGSLSGNTLTLTRKKNGQVCTIRIQFAVETAEVNENSCSDYHGAACGFNGTLKKLD